MLQYVVRRLLWLPVLLFIVTFVTFALGLHGPGDPITVMLGQHATPEAVERFRHELGLDQPLLVQYGKWLWQVLHGNLGESLRYKGQPVTRLMGQALKITIPLNIAALSLSVFVGIPLGLLAAFKRDSWLDRLIVASVVLGNSVPTFVIAPILLYLFAVTLRLLPPGGWDGIFSTNTILPVAVLASGPITTLARQTRVAVIEALTSDYVRTARAKGLGNWYWGRKLERAGLSKLLIPLDVLRGELRGVMIRHVFRNALIPVVTIVGLMMGGLVTGSIMVEAVFGIPGVGSLALGAMAGYDYPITIAFTAIVAAAYIGANLLVDLLYGVINPQVRIGR